ncbi:hypothetical protein Nepgr_026711 [Nepenthes gracilis]|uniref:DUF4283 domain-containing protein n=1 Tax=Nepenthes gracilis TaxID=150966 RepID=A0AAD3Y0T9_NEPGR|nr:hypothetical protein Nepgr_026711 [Nepenthes gracilis]
MSSFVVSSARKIWACEGGPWSFAGFPIFLKVRKLGMDMKRDKLNTSPIWIKLRNLPRSSGLIRALVMLPMILRKEYAIEAAAEYTWKPTFYKGCKLPSRSNKPCKKLAKKKEFRPTGYLIKNVDPPVLRADGLAGAQEVDCAVSAPIGFLVLRLGAGVALEKSNPFSVLKIQMG